MRYRAGPTLTLLHYRKSMYQRTMLLAWAIVLVGLAPLVWLLHPKSTDIIMDGNGLWGSARPDNRAGYGGGNGSETGGPAAMMNAGFQIVADHHAGGSAGSASAPSVRSLFGNLEIGPDDAAGLPDRYGRSGYGDGSGNAAGPGNDDFGLPGRPLYAHTIGSARWPGPARESIEEKRGSPAVIEWVAPVYPKVGLSSKVLCLVDLTADGRKTIEVLYTETWNQFDGRRSNVQFFTGPDKWGYARAVVSALMESIFWPATDGDGRGLPGRFVIFSTFCPFCPPEAEPARVVSGDVVLRTARP